MDDNTQLIGKVLVLDDSTEYFAPIKPFCDQNGLLGLKANGSNITAILKPYRKYR